MTQRNQTVFYLEHLQPDWLPGSRMLRVYDLVAVGLPGMLMGVLVSISINAFISGSPNLSNLLQSILLGGFLGGFLSEGRIPQRLIVSRGKARSPLGLRLLPWLLIGALVGLGSGLSFGLYGPFLGSYMLSLGLSLGLGSVLLQFLLRKTDAAEARAQTLPSAEGTAWRRLVRRRAVYNGLLVSLLVWLSFILSSVSNLSSLSNGLSLGLYNGLGFGLSLGLTTAALLLDERGAREIGTLENLAQTHIRLEICSNLL